MTVSTTGGTSTQSGTISNSQQWAQAIEQAGGYPQTASNTQFLEAWAQAEGGMWNNSAAYNPINTTQQASGSTSMNSVGVQAYTSWDQGIAATLQTLNNGYYNNITSALANGNATQQAQAGNLDSDLNTWGTGSGFISNGVLSSPTVQGGATGGSSWSAAGVAAQGIGNSTGTSSSSGSTGTTASGGSGTGPTGLLSNCYAYGTSKNSNGSSCLISPPGGWCFTACEAKALVSGLIIFGGGVLMLAGAALLFAGSSGPLGKVATAVGGYEVVQSVTRHVSNGSARARGVSQSDRTARKGAEHARSMSNPHKKYPGRSVAADEGEF